MLEFETYYHIYNHANGDENLFREEKNYPFFLEKYYQHIDPIADTIAWCLMPNHFHLLVKIRSEKEIVDHFSSSSKGSFLKFETLEKFATAEEEKLKFLSKQFSNFFSSYSQAYNKLYNRKGSLFLKNFKRKEIKDEKYLIRLLVYIHRNPVQHGFTNQPEDWNWSSFRLFPKSQLELLSIYFDNLENYNFVHQKMNNVGADFDF
ncbi:MAG: transposase [Chitinophagales bacterium]|nr:transposase [Chitinophagales bacterium]MCZ2392467.1 transposase [Chitinophagales bacterium]